MSSRWLAQQLAIRFFEDRLEKLDEVDLDEAEVRLYEMGIIADELKEREQSG